MLLRAALEKGGTFRFGCRQGSGGADTSITAGLIVFVIVERLP
jgi:hypothetical protein